MTSEGLALRGGPAGGPALGYAEADPTLDVDGTDTAHKLAILAQLAFEANVRLDDHPAAGDRPAPDGRPQVRRRARLRHQAAGPGAALDRRRAGAPRGADAGPARHARWRRSAGPTTRSASWATRSAIHSSTAEVPARCRPRRPWSATCIEVAHRSGRLPSRLAQPLVGLGPGGPAGAGRPTSAAGIISASRSPTARACSGRLAQILGDKRNQHRQRDPARPRRRRPRAEPRPAGHHDASRRPGRSVMPPST